MDPHRSDHQHTLLPVQLSCFLHIAFLLSVAFPQNQASPPVIHSPLSPTSTRSCVRCPLARRDLFAFACSWSLWGVLPGSLRLSCRRSLHPPPSHGQSLRPLVRVSSRHYCPSTPRLFSSSSSSGLSGFPPAEPHLEVGFPLRCFQRLSAPEMATRLCTWQYNRHTSAPSIPVLSY